jgi:hypothetical protein
VVSSGTRGTVLYLADGIDNAAQFSCLACGGPLEPTLAQLASTRCHDCRDDDVPLDPALVDRADAAQRLPRDSR